MTTDQEQAVQEAITQLRARYADKLRARMDALEAAWQEVHETPDPVPSRLDDLMRLAHALSGAAGRFGFPAVRDHAALLARFVRELMRNPDPGGDVSLDALQGYLGQIRIALDTASLEEGRPSATALQTLPPAPPILVLTDDELLSGRVSLELARCGYPSRVFPDPRELDARIAEHGPAALIVDADLEGVSGGSAGIEAVSASLAADKACVPVIFIGEHDDLPVRLSAARAGGCAFFAKPVDMQSLLDRLEFFLHARVEEPYRVLVVEDDLLQGEQDATILAGAGLSVRVHDAGDDLLDVLQDMRPELILMDLRLSREGYTGADVARVLRQHEIGLDVPIVFLASGQDPDQQFAVLRQGGDTLLTRPVQAAHLLDAVLGGVTRSRMARHYRMRDSLTGLLNHSSLKERLDTLVGHAERSGEPLSVAMVDIDNFKRINDRFGHAAGDRVIRGTARLLTGRLRRYDVVGRYGGDAFAVLLPGTDEASAAALLSGLLDPGEAGQYHFGETRHQITCSVGVAGMNAAMDSPGALLERADRALRAARSGGRDRVVRATEL